MKISRRTYLLAATLTAVTVSFGVVLADTDPDPEVCYERCMELVKKGRIKDKKKCDFCFELKKQDAPES